MTGILSCKRSVLQGSEQRSPSNPVSGKLSAPLAVFIAEFIPAFTTVLS